MEPGTSANCKKPQKAVSSQAEHFSRVFAVRQSETMANVAGLPHPACGLYSRHRSLTAGSGADDGTPDGLLQPLPVARRLRGGPDRPGLRATGDPKYAGRDPRPVDGHRGAAGFARARGAAGVDLEEAPAHPQP